LDTPNKSPGFEEATYSKVGWRLIPFLFLCYIVAFLDRVNVGFAKLQMAGDLKFSDAVFGFGAGIFFVGYFIFEVPSNVVLQRVGARRWIARIMVSWGILSSAFLFTGRLHWGTLATMFNCNDAEFSFYFLRLLLGVAEAGFFPGIILYLTYWFPGPRRARMVAFFMTAVAISNVIGAPVSGAIMQYADGLQGLRGWQWLFLIEGVPSILVGIAVLALLPDDPRDAGWLTGDERDFVIARVNEYEGEKRTSGQPHSLLDAFKDGRVWALAVVYFCGIICFYAVNFWMPTIIQEFGTDKKDFLRVGLLSMIPWGAAAIAQVFWGAHSDNTGERRWHASGGLLLAMVGLLLLSAFGHAAVPGIFALTCVTVGLGCWVVTFWSLPTAFLSGTAAAAGIAWINSVGNLGGYFGPDLIGRIRVATGGASPSAFLTLAAMALLGALIILLLARAQPKAVAPVTDLGVASPTRTSGAS